MKLAPIVLFAYNRPLYLLKTLQSLQANEEAKDSALYIYCDGPKAGATESTLKTIEEVQLIAKREKWCGEVNVIISSVNKGLAPSVKDGVTEIVNRYDKVIVMEDDLVVSEFYLKYMNYALEKYANEDRVASVSGYNFPIDLGQNSDLKQTFFLKSTSTLGWGVWARSWKLYNGDAAFLLEEIKSKKLDFQFNFDDAYPYIKMLKNVIKKKISSWGIRWYASVFLSDKLTLFPMYSLVNHIGNDGTNVKIDSTGIFGNSVYNKQIIGFEDCVEENIQYRKLFSEHFSKYDHRKITFENIKYYFVRILVVIKKYRNKLHN